MGWRERFTETASFRGVEFKVQRESRPFGRKIQIDSYLFEDEVGTEDTGGVPKTFSIEGIVVGDDYDRQRKRLEAAANRRGPGKLVHPYKGTLQVLCQPGTSSTRVTEAGVARFAFNFIKYAPPESPRKTKDTRGGLRLGAVEGKAKIKKSLLDRLGFVGTVIRAAQKAQAKVEELGAKLDTFVEDSVGIDLDGIAELSSSVAKFADKAVELSTDPDALFDAATSAIRSVVKIDEIVENGYRLAVGLAIFGNDEIGGSVTTADGQAVEEVRLGFNEMVRRAAVIEAAELSSEFDPVSGPDAVRLRDRTLALLDVEISAAAAVNDDNAYRALRDMRSGVIDDARERLTRLPEILTVTTPAILPSILIAYRYHGDASRAEEIVRRNELRDAAFVAAGTELEILADGSSV